MVAPPGGIDLKQTGQHGYANEAGSTIHFVAAPFLFICII